MRRVEVVVVGAGAAGLGLAVRLARQGTDHLLLTAPPGPHVPPERTWCSWQDGPVPWADAVSAVWHEVAVHGPDGRERRLPLAPFRYEQVRSRDFERWAGREVRPEQAVVHAVEDGPARAVVRTSGGDVAARWVVDTRPVAPARPGRVSLLQHFRGWFVRTSADAFDPAVAGFMDFRTPQPPGAVAFGYVLPTSPREALVEHTLFSRARLPSEAYDAGLRALTASLPPFEVLGVEEGAIPMTDAPFPARAGRSVVRLGTAGGATRPSTGYTFAAAQRQAAAVAAQLARGEAPDPPPAYPARHLLMDALLLAGIDRGTVDGAAFLTRLFDRQPVARVLRFLDGATSPREDLAVMAAAPVLPMLRTGLGLLRRPRPPR